MKKMFAHQRPEQQKQFICLMLLFSIKIHHEKRVILSLEKLFSPEPASSESIRSRFLKTPIVSLDTEGQFSQTCGKRFSRCLDLFLSKMKKVYECILITGNFFPKLFLWTRKMHFRQPCPNVSLKGRCFLLKVWKKWLYVLYRKFLP